MFLCEQKKDLKGSFIKLFSNIHHIITKYIYIYKYIKYSSNYNIKLLTLDMVGGEDEDGKGMENSLVPFSFSTIYLHYVTSCTKHMPFYNFDKGLNKEKYKEQKE